MLDSCSDSFVVEGNRSIFTPCFSPASWLRYAISARASIGQESGGLVSGSDLASISATKVENGKHIWAVPVVDATKAFRVQNNPALCIRKCRGPDCRAIACRLPFLSVLVRIENHQTDRYADLIGQPFARAVERVGMLGLVPAMRMPLDRAVQIVSVVPACHVSPSVARACRRRTWASTS